jgi:hypothetical protein
MPPPELTNAAFISGQTEGMGAPADDHGVVPGDAERAEERHDVERRR